jgi:hypothetical protein
MVINKPPEESGFYAGAGSMVQGAKKKKPANYLQAFVF